MATQELSKAELKRLRRLDDPDLTESDSDEETVEKPLDSQVTNASEEKEIEVIIDLLDDTEGSQYLQDLEAKPNFNHLSEPPAAGPHIIDKERNIQIPSSINRYLRKYQREGVDFLWSRYDENSGGILGDDMVSRITC